MSGLPKVLLIGAEKCGTTTLYRDLEATGRFAFAEDKEPRDLVDDHVLSPAGQSQYAAKFTPEVDQLCCDASTDYSKIHEFPGVPARAAAVLGNSLTIIYVMRHPVERALSHHRHQFAMGLVPEDFMVAMEQFPKLTNNGLYATQIRPWIDQFGVDAIVPIKFEEFVADRATTLSGIGAALGLDLAGNSTPLGEAQNASAEARVVYGGWRTLSQSGAYRRFVRPLMTPEIRAAIRSKILRKPPMPQGALSAQDRQGYGARFLDDGVELRRLFPGADLSWDL